MRNRNRSEARNSGSRYDERRAGGTHNDSRRRPAYDDDRRRTGDRRQQQQDDRIRGEERRFSDDDRRDRYDDNKNYNNRRNNPLDENNNKRKPTEIVERKQQQQNQEETVSDEKLVKPAGTGSIFDRPRPLPRINRPVPKSEKNKFAYKASESPNVNVRDGSKNDDANASYEYEDISISSSTSSTTPKSSAAPSSTKPFSFQKLKPASSLSTTIKTTTTTTTTKASVDDGAEVYEYVYEDEDYDTVVTPTQKPIIEISSIKPKDERASLYSSRVRNEYIASSTLPSTTTSTTAASSPDSFRLNRYKNDNSRENIQQQPSYVDPLVRKPLVPSIIPNRNANNRKFANKQTVFEPVTQEIPTKKFSFQNAYNNRNLDNKAEIESIAEDKEQLQKSTVKVIKRPFLPSRGGNPYKARGLQPVGILAEQQQQQQQSNEKQEDEKNVSYNDGNRKQTDTQKLTLEDLYEEYDVDLNDALNPMLKPLTSSRNVQGFSSRSSTVDVNDKDHPQSSQNTKVVSKTDQLISKPAAAAVSSQKGTTTPLPEYYEDELEYDTYADDVA